VPKEDIPAVTQLFTPHWIVRYLVENSLGRLWMLNHPDSKLANQMEYFIKSDPPLTSSGDVKDYIRINSPEEIKICDPACGSGHMLTYAFDLLTAMYEERGYDPVQIPSLILKNNLYGIEIDERAGQLAAFALMMKARQKDKRFFTRGINPNICVMEDISFSAIDISAYMEKIGSDLFTQELWFGLQQFENAKTFGSLIHPQIRDPREVIQRMENKGAFEDLFLFKTNCKVKKVLEMTEYLMPRYHIVLSNPPYLGINRTEINFRKFAKDYYQNSKDDTCTMFMESNLKMLRNFGFLGMITIPSWMFLSSFMQLRKYLLLETVIETLIQNGRGIWGSDFGSCAFVIGKRKDLNYRGIYKSLYKIQGKTSTNEVIQKRFFDEKQFPNFNISAKDLIKIPGSPIAYWLSQKIIKVFESLKPLKEFLDIRQGMSTTDNKKYLRRWYEVSIPYIAFNVNDAIDSNKKGINWFPYNKGGMYRKWYGNNEFIIFYTNNGNDLINMVREKYPRISDPEFVIKNRRYFFKPSITWSFVSISYFGVRYSEKGFIFDVGGSSAFIEDDDLRILFTGLLCSKISSVFLNALNPTINFPVESLEAIPVPFEKLINIKQLLLEIQKKCIENLKNDWNNYETSWEFSTTLLLNNHYQKQILSDAYQHMREDIRNLIHETQILEVENNKLIFKAYDLEDEFVPDVSLEDITLTCNPRYRYSGRKSEGELEALLLADTMKEFISYAVGCMFGRYSLDKPGLILANQGEILQDYLNQITQPKFMPDKDNVLPILEGEWFADDIVSRFREFLKVTFGEQYFDENLIFLENAIGRDIRAYFLRDFYGEHVKMYKKRPIYWLFSSPKGSFNALIYMHRYTPDTVSIILNQYLIPYREKLSAKKSHLQVISQNGNASSAEKNRAIKEINQINAVLLELREYEDEILYPLARERVAIDLDDGVKVNYAKFGRALKFISGLSE
jgi:type II restriction/modification system DNA methylase subunit YeeA